MSLNTISLAIAWERRVSKGIWYFKQIECSAFAEYQRLSIRLSWSAFQNSEHLSVYSLMIYQLRRSEPNVSQASLRALFTRFLPSILGLDCACQPLLFGDHEDSSTLTMACNYEVHLMAFNLACP